MPQIQGVRLSLIQTPLEHADSGADEHSTVGCCKVIARVSCNCRRVPPSTSLSQILHMECPIEIATGAQSQTMAVSNASSACSITSIGSCGQTRCVCPSMARRPSVHSSRCGGRLASARSVTSCGRRITLRGCAIGTIAMSKLICLAKERPPLPRDRRIAAGTFQFAEEFPAYRNINEGGRCPVSVRAVTCLMLSWITECPFSVS